MTLTLRAALVALAFAAPVEAAEVALIIGNEDYDEIDDVERGNDLTRATGGLREAGVEVISERNADAIDAIEAVGEFAQAAAETDDALVAVLSGRFVNSDFETYLLPVNSDGFRYVRVLRQAVPLSAVLTVLAESDRTGLLILATDEWREGLSPFLRAGIGAVERAPGVAVVRTDPLTARRIVAEILPQQNRRLVAALREIGADYQGTVRPNYAFLGGAEPPSRAPDAADRNEAQAWRRAQRADGIEAYLNYLDRFPNGEHALEARLRVEEIRRDPVRIAQRVEEQLNLTREERRRVQRGLSLLGFETRGIDGIFGPGTRGAITSWQRQNDLTPTGYLTSAQVALIAEQAASRRVDMEEQAAERRAQQEREDRAWWRQTGANETEEGYRAYLERYPDGRYAEMAHNRLARIARQSWRRADAYERDLWDEAREIDTVERYRTYLDQFPEGEFATAARARIEELRSRARPEMQQARQAEEALGLNPMTARLVEERLNALGLKPGRVDGNLDDRSRRAIRRYQGERNLPVTGFLNEATVVRLLADSVRQLIE